MLGGNGATSPGCAMIVDEDVEDIASNNQSSYLETLDNMPPLKLLDGYVVIKEMQYLTCLSKAYFNFISLVLTNFCR